MSRRTLSMVIASRSSWKHGISHDHYQNACFLRYSGTAKAVSASRITATVC